MIIKSLIQTTLCTKKPWRAPSEVEMPLWMPVSTRMGSWPRHQVLLRSMIILKEASRRTKQKRERKIKKQLKILDHRYWSWWAISNIRQLIRMEARFNQKGLWWMLVSRIKQGHCKTSIWATKGSIVKDNLKKERKLFNQVLISFRWYRPRIIIKMMAHRL